MKKFIAAPVLAIAAVSLAACGETASADGAASGDTASAITAEEVAAAQKAWGEGIVKIGKVSTDGGDVRQAATDHINQFYGYEDGEEILFKPTLAAEDQFRGDFDGALSYFIGTEGTDDGGFAIQPALVAQAFLRQRPGHGQIFGLLNLAQKVVDRKIGL